MGILVVSGPSGAGKSTLIKKLLEEEDGIYFSISHTTREPRENEVDGKNYFFISKEEFEKDIADGMFLEYAKVHEYYYGSSLRPIRKALEENKLVLFDIDVQGFLLIRKIYPRLSSVFITTKNQNDLACRLQNRADTPNEDIKTRLINANLEMALIKEYDFLIINDDLKASYKDFKAIFKSAKLNTAFKDIDKFLLNWKETK